MICLLDAAFEMKQSYEFLKVGLFDTCRSVIISPNRLYGAISG